MAADRLADEKELAEHLMVVEKYSHVMHLMSQVEGKLDGGLRAVGYFNFGGETMDTAITIRTVVVKDGKAYVQAGAGVVFDSVAANEYAETLNKARALLKAAAMVGG